MTTHTPARRGDLLTGKIDGEGVVYDRTRGSVHSLNGTAQCVWDLCDGQHRTDEIAERICSCFEVPLSTAKEDVVRVTSLFRELGLLED